MGVDNFVAGSDIKEGQAVYFKDGKVYPLDISKRNLPHWQQPGTSYFVTFRLADSIPVERVNRIKDERKIWLMRHSEPYSDDNWREYNRLFSDTIKFIKRVDPI